MGDVEHVIQAIRREFELRKSWEEAARVVKTRDHKRCVRVMETIGSWPSSELELAALQSVWP